MKSSGIRKTPAPIGDSPPTRRVDLISRTGTAEDLTAQLIALIAYPEPDEAAKRNAAERKLHGAILQRALEANRRKQDSLSAYETNSLEIFTGARSLFDALERRLRRRLAVGNGAAALLFAGQGETVGFPEDFGEATLQHFFEWLANNREGEERTLERRHWNAALPVLNLLIALCLLLSRRWRDGRQVEHILDIAFEGELLGQWIAIGNDLIEPVRARWPRRFKDRPLVELALIVGDTQVWPEANTASSPGGPDKN